MALGKGGGYWCGSLQLLRSMDNLQRELCREPLSMVHTRHNKRVHVQAGP